MNKCIYTMAAKRKELQGSEFLVFIGLTYHYNQQTDQCRCSVADIARSSRCSVSTVKRNLASLESTGIIRVDRDGKNRCNYWLKGISGKKQLTEEQRVRDKQLENMFEVFWNEYPRGTAKQKTKAKFMQLCQDEANFRAIMADVRRRVNDDWQGAEIKYIPHSMTYLNQQRWLDKQVEQPQREASNNDFI